MRFTPACRYFVLAKTDPTAKAGEAFTGFIVDRDSPGVTPGRKVRIQAINQFLLGETKNMCVSGYMLLKIRVGRSAYFFYFLN